MKTIDEHLAQVLAAVPALNVETVSLAEAHNRVLREAVHSPVYLPPWPNSAMDGYAVRLADLASASADNPVQLAVAGDIPAGSTTPAELASGTVHRIMTGAPIPAGCDAIVPLERVAEWDEAMPTADAPLPAHVTFIDVPAAGAHIRRAGEDAREGDLIVDAGTLLTSNRIAALAAVGVTEVLVSAAPRVAAIATGTELVEPGQPLGFGQIYDSNSSLVATLATENLALVSSQQRVADDADALRAAIRRAQAEADVIVLTGGASVGAFDATRAVLDQELTSGEPSTEDELRRVAFDKVAMQPGKPQGFGLLDDGTLVFALPGNPVSVWVSFYMFVEPALRAALARSENPALWHQVRVSDGWKTPPGREQLMPIVISSAPGDPLTIRPASVKGSGSHLAATLALATGIARVPAEVSEVRENDVVLMRGTSQ